jgi:hypothetical protein
VVLAAALSAQPALADDDDPTIREVWVNFDGPSRHTLMIRGEDLTGKEGKYETKVILGEQGPLEVISAAKTEIIVKCFVDNSAAYPAKDDFDCNDGDYKLTVLVVKSEKKGKKDDDDDDRDKDEKGYKVKGKDSFDLTIGAVTLSTLSCDPGQVAKYEGDGEWSCQDDTDTQRTDAEIRAVVGPHTVDTDTQRTDAEIRAVVGPHTVDTNTQRTDAEIRAVVGPHTVRNDPPGFFSIFRRQSTRNVIGQSAVDFVGCNDNEWLTACSGSCAVDNGTFDTSDLERVSTKAILRPSAEEGPTLGAGCQQNCERNGTINRKISIMVEAYCLQPTAP